MSRIARAKTAIPVLWHSECRGIPMAIATADGIQKMAVREGYSVQFYESCEALLQNQPDCRSVIVIGFESSNMSGVLVKLQLAKKRIVVTGVDTDHMDVSYSCVSFSRRLATEQLLDYLLEKGCRRIAMVGTDNRSSNDMVHIDAMQSYCQRRAGVICGHFGYGDVIEESFEAFTDVWKQYDAVLCPNAFTSVLFLRFCQQKGLQVPRDFLLVSIKDNDINRYCKPSLTSLVVDYFGIGQQSVGVWTYLQDPANADFRIRIAQHGELVVRESTGIDLPIEKENSRSPLDESYGGGAFYQIPSIRGLMQLERCLQVCDELDLRILSLLAEGKNYETICEQLFLSESSLQYRTRKLFRAAHTSGKREFTRLLTDYFTLENHFAG